MRRKIERMQREVNEFMEYVKQELARGLDDWEQRLNTALVKSSPADLVRAPAPTAPRLGRRGRPDGRAAADVGLSRPPLPRGYHSPWGDNPATKRTKRPPCRPTCRKSRSCRA